MARPSMMRKKKDSSLRKKGGCAAYIRKREAQPGYSESHARNLTNNNLIVFYK